MAQSMAPDRLTSSEVSEDNDLAIRALQVIPGSPEGPSYNFAKRQVASLPKVGIAVRTFFLASRTSPTTLVKEWSRLQNEIRNFNPHLIHAHFGTMTAFLCAFGTTMPLVVTFRGSDLNPVPSISVLRSTGGRLLSQLAAFRATRIICVTGQLKARLWWGKGRTTIIPDGVNMSVFSPRSQEEARAALGWHNADRVVLFCAGKFPKKKRLDLALQAAEAAKVLCSDLRLVVLESAAPESIPLFLNAADCLLFTSDWEGSPNIIKEAMACNLPIVSVDVGDVAERLEGVSHSKIVSRDPHQLGAALSKILMLNSRSNGRTMVRDLSEEMVAERIRSVYDSTVGGE